MFDNVKKSQYNMSIIAYNICCILQSEEKVGIKMLVGFSVSNFMSFADTQSISLVAGKVMRHKNHIAEIGNRKVLKSGLIFGANAGGKSNLIKAIDFSRGIILYGLDAVDTNKKHFRINSEAYNSPGIFEYRIVANGDEYSYGIVISYSKKEIISEWLTKIQPKNDDIIIFNRETDENGLSRVETDISYNTEEENVRMKVYLDDFGENISESFKKKSILSDIGLRINGKQRMFPEISSVFEWFKQMIILFPDSRLANINDAIADNRKRSFFTRTLVGFDTGIESIEMQEEEMDFEKILNELPKEAVEQIKIDISNKANEHPIMFHVNEQAYLLRKDENGNLVYNKMGLNHGNGLDLFDLADESDGTKRLFDLIPLLEFNAFRSTILIDEIDRSLHNNLTRHFMEMFYSMAEEKFCQLIVTTHDSNLLDLELVRQDEIWFVDRQEDHSSMIYSLNKFKERFDKKVDKEYLLGRYGAIPIFNQINVDLGDEDE